MRLDSNDDTSDITGIRFSQGSDSKCASDASKTYSLVTELTCDEGSDVAKVDKVKQDGCDFIV